jgi:hypothetical protein
MGVVSPEAVTSPTAQEAATGLPPQQHQQQHGQQGQVEASCTAGKRITARVCTSRLPGQTIVSLNAWNSSGSLLADFLGLLAHAVLQFVMRLLRAAPSYSCNINSQMVGVVLVVRHLCTHVLYVTELVAMSGAPPGAYVWGWVSPWWQNAQLCAALDSL